MEGSMVTLKAAVLLSSLLCFVSLRTKGCKAHEIQWFVVFVAALAFLIANDKILSPFTVRTTI